MGVVGRQQQTHLIHHKILALDRTREAASEEKALVTAYSKINQRPAGLEKVLTTGL